MDSFTKRFVEHNKRMFPRRATPGRSVVLFEFNSLSSAIIAYSYFATVLAKKHDAEIVAYIPRLVPEWRRAVEWIPNALFRIYRSFGTTRVIVPRLSRQQEAALGALFDEVIERLRTKADVEDLTVHGVFIGDLVYDSYLMDYKRPTIDVTLAEFHESLRGSLGLLIYWEDYFSRHDVKAVNVSHCVYNLALPLRVALARGVAAYQVNATHAYALNNSNMFAYTDFHEFHQQFSRLPAAQRDGALERVDGRINRRLGGEVGVDMPYSTQSAYGAAKTHRLLRESHRLKILVATHCFFDSPHSYGRNLFPDFYEWLEFLGKITQETDYDWYIKTHPDYLPGTMQIIQEFIRRYPRFTLLPPDSSHHQLIAEGIDVALTVWGTIGIEYAALNKPVINASVNNPHISYSFNAHPDSAQAYGELLRRLPQLDLAIDQDEVRECYFMRYIHNTDDWLFGDYARMENTIGYNQQFSSTIYDYWLRQWSKEWHMRTLAVVERFVESGDFRLGHQHLDQQS